MRVAVAGSTGAVGVPLVRRLREGGHEVVELSRRLGVDVFDLDSLRGALTPAPDVVVQQLTALPQRISPKALRVGIETTNRLRAEGTRNLATAAPGARLISQSVAFYYRPNDRPNTEEEPLWTDGPDPAPAVTTALAEMDRITLESGGVSLRYGYFYGPGTWYSPDGAAADDARRRRMPIIGKGRGVWSWVHVEDAAEAVLAVLERGSGIYNICDDEPAPVSEWMPEFAANVGAPKPMKVPRAVGRLAAGSFVVAQFDELQGASNARARRELGWQPRHPTWRGNLGRA